MPHSRSADGNHRHRRHASDAFPGKIEEIFRYLMVLSESGADAGRLKRASHAGADVAMVDLIVTRN